MNNRGLRTLTHETSIVAQLADMRIAAALDEIDRQLDNLDGYPTTASGADTGPHTQNTTSSTEHAGLARIGDDRRPGVAYQRDELADWLLTAKHATRSALAIIEKYTTSKLTVADLRRLRCIGTGNPDGSTCTAFADPTRSDGRCTQCGPAVDRAATQARSDDAARKRRKYHNERQPTT